MSFTWIPIYEELATALIAYESRQSELIQLLADLNAGDIPALPIQDQTAAGAAPLTEIDPFTFFASFNRGQTEANRRAVLDRFKTHFALTSAVPTDFDGIPVADKRSSWFFPYSTDRSDEIPTLWALAKQAVAGGRQAIDAKAFDRCLQIKTVKIGKLTMGLYWIRPQGFLTLDSRSTNYLRARIVAVPDRVESWSSYAKVLDGAVAALGSDFARISLDAYQHRPEDSTAPRPVRYWAGGHQFGNESKAPEFLRDHTWYIGHARDSDNKGAVSAWSRIASIRPGDLFAIKGYGGKNDLQIRAVGRVESVDADQGALRWAPVDIPLFHGKAPGGPGGGTWFETLCEVTSPDVQRAVFGVGSARSTTTSMKTPRVPTPDVPLNLILHGPPGTGKTFRMRGLRSAFDLHATPPAHDVADLSWFEVVALALHDFGRPAEALEIVAHPLVQAKYVERAPTTKLGPYVWAYLQGHTVRDSKTVRYARRTEPLVFDKQEDSKWFLPKGLPDELQPMGSAAAPTTPDNQFFVTFHPSFTYEDFVEGIRLESDEEGGPVRYPLRAGIFKQACERAVQLAGFDRGLAEFCLLAPDERRRMLADAQPAALFIDEINRGNVARILGELITLIEPDKRLGADQELIVSLPGSRQRFGVPSNLWIVGTMNTADRSVVALDVALRRRFAFEDCPPCPELLDDLNIEGVNVGQLLRAINRRLLVLRDRDHLIGHAFFLPLRGSPTLDSLRRVFSESVLPLLLEYFHDDLGRVGLVLGPAWVHHAAGSDVFAKGFDHDHRDDLAERPVWEVADVLALPAEAFRAIDG